ncbi:MAG: EF-hand domain-containing protein [Hyphomonadaceae bacterium]
MRADANNDGAITQAEARAAREAMFARMDSNGDGYLTIADREARRAAMQARREARRERFMNDRDTDNDGRISRAEFAADGAHFERLDTNDNGVLEPNELEAARQQMAARRAARQGQTE